MTPAVIREEHPGSRWKKCRPRGRKSWVRRVWEERGETERRQGGWEEASEAGRPEMRPHVSVEDRGKI